ncbi:MAG: AraC family transcriptional regulator [Labilithrix sp.]|nr:AraC family transcriptional regulator [Labilithrix sp.]MBX3221762.1 AraC family transcriptional regulator [Labilithrix sp.]
MRTFSDVMTAVRTARSRYGVLEATAPWGVEAGSTDASSLYLMTRGACWLESDAIEQPLRISSGDVVLVSSGGKHTLRDALTSPIESRILASGDEGTDTHAIGGGGAPSSLICGDLVMADRQSPLFERLPPVVHLVGPERSDLTSLSATVSLLAAEVASARPSAATVVNRLFDVIFVKVVFSYFESQSASAESWLGALRDRQVSDALAAIQKNPELPWTVASLAAHVKMSRSAFAARFSVLVGDTPLQYVTRARMQRAATILRGEDVRLASVAEATGYESEAAFSKAFKRFMGMSPSDYRRAFLPSAG